VLLSIIIAVARSPDMAGRQTIVAIIEVALDAAFVGGAVWANA
jgi:hypothetical protein